MHACIYKVSKFIGSKGPRSLQRLSFCQMKGEVSIGTLIILRLDVVHKGLHALMKVLECITLSTCEAWQVVV